MTRIIITILTIILSLLARAQDQVTTSTEGIIINVTIPEIANAKGKVYFALYNSKEGFNQRQTFQVTEGEIVDGKTEVQFTNVPNGVYAITCYHDANDNKKLDFEGYRPIEDFGSSNNPRTFGPPRFGPSKFEVNDEDLFLTINF